LRKRSSREIAGWTLALVVLCVVPWLVPAGYVRRLINVAAIQTLLVLSLNLLYGYAGQFSFGHAGFWGVGAYTTALLTTSLGAPFWVALPISAVAAGLLGVVVGFPALKLRGPYLAFATLGCGEIVRLILLNWKDVTGGQDGIAGIPAATVGPLTFRTDLQFYYLVLAAVMLTALALHRLRLSRHGRAYVAIRESEVAASAMGVPIARVKIEAFVLSAMLAGVAGNLYAHLFRYVSPDVFTFDVSVGLMLMLLVGGVGTIAGAVVGAVLLTILPEILRFTREYYMAIYGAGILVLLILLPDGLAGLGRRWLRTRDSRRADVVVAPADAVRPGHARSADAAPIFVAHDVTRAFGGLIALDGVSFSVAAGEIRGLIGPNGSGKTTCLNVLTGIYTPTRGTAHFRGAPILGRPPHAITTLGIARTFQNIRVFPHLSALDNVMVGQHCRTGAGVASVILRNRHARAEESKIAAVASGALARVGLGDRQRVVAGSLAYGERRLLEIARALATEPEMLLLDEPAAGLNPHETERLMRLIEGLRDDGLTLIVVEHNMRLVMGVCDRITVLDFGRKVMEGAPEDVRVHPGVIEAYLGREALAT
jgi:branched-chain amino acid transport system permease protein